MDVMAHLDDLTIIHPQLLWDDIRAATVAVFIDSGAEAPFKFKLAVREVPGFDDDTLWMTIDARTVPDIHVARLRRTCLPSPA